MSKVYAKGCDVSQHQGNVDFNKVKKAGYNFVIIRAGFGKYENQKDPYFEQNYTRAKAAGLDVGVYWYSYALSKQDAIQEANVCYNIIKGKQFEYGVYFDIEDPSQEGCGNGTIQEMIEAFCSTLEKKGYYVGYYSFASFLYNKVPLSFRNSNKYDLWVAQWSSKCTYNSHYGMWQFTDVGIIPGISGNVDLNYAYKDYPSIIKSAGLNGFKKSTSSKTDSAVSEKNTNTEEKKTSLKSIDTIVGEILDGKWGNGDSRKKKLTSAGYNYTDVQNRVNDYLKAVDDVINGVYGNGSTRVNKLRSAGFDNKIVQKAVNKKLGVK